MNNQSSFDRFLHLGDTAENYDLDTEMLETIGISPDIYEKAGLLMRCPIPFSVDCLTCGESAEIMVRHDELIAKGIFPSILCHGHQKTVQKPVLSTIAVGQGSVL